jgi:hypothetical protein
MTAATALADGLMEGGRVLTDDGGRSLQARGVINDGSARAVVTLRGSIRAPASPDAEGGAGPSAHR